MTDFEHVYRSYFKDVEHYLLALSKDVGLAEELASQVFFKALHNLAPANFFILLTRLQLPIVCCCCCCCC